MAWGTLRSGHERVPSACGVAVLQCACIMTCGSRSLGGHKACRPQRSMALGTCSRRGRHAHLVGGANGMPACTGPKPHHHRGKLLRVAGSAKFASPRHSPDTCASSSDMVAARSKAARLVTNDRSPLLGIRGR